MNVCDTITLVTVKFQEVRQSKLSVNFLKEQIIFIIHNLHQNLFSLQKILLLEINFIIFFKKLFLFKFLRFKPWYLEECSSTLATTYSSGTPGHDKSVATVDMDGQLRPDRICTVEHTGTSASAPLAAGIAALALEANPNLTWRDLQYLVVLTSRPDPLDKEAGWILNGVKRKISHKFGYGLMDAGAMVSLAEQWNSVPAQHICKSREINEDRSIESSVGYTLQTHMDVNGCAGTVNEVCIYFNVQVISKKTSYYLI